jgi:hypothetical protein
LGNKRNKILSANAFSKKPHLSYLASKKATWQHWFKSSSHHAEAFAQNRPVKKFQESLGYSGHFSAACLCDISVSV